MSKVDQFLRGQGVVERYRNGIQQWNSPQDESDYPIDNFIALDTEGTGLNFRKTDFDKRIIPARPFIVTIHDQDLNHVYIREWYVDPRTRKVLPAVADLRELYDVLHNYQHIVFHNARYDLSALYHVADSVGKWDAKFKTFIEELCRKQRRIRFDDKGPFIHDTQGMSHVAKSGDPHDLKSLAVKYLKMPDDDERFLKDQAATLTKWFRNNKEVKDDERFAGIRSCEGSGANYWVVKWAYRNAGLLTKLGCSIKFKAEMDTAAVDYATLDTVRTVGLFKLFQYALTKEKLWNHYERERLLVPIFWEMEQRGIPLIEENFETAATTIRESQEGSAQKFRGLLHNSDINLASPKQLKEELFDRMGLPVVKFTASGEPSLDKHAVGSMLDKIGEKYKFNHVEMDPDTQVLRDGPISRNYPEKYCSITTKPPFDITPKNRKGILAAYILKCYQHWKQSTSALNYLNQYQAARIGYRLHPEWNQWGTRTVRVSSSNPNGQNIGKVEMDALDEADGDGGRHAFVIRSVFGPRPGKAWLCIDFNQLELRLKARQCNDPGLLQVLNNGKDHHQFTTDALNAIRKEYGLPPLPRKGGKFFNFAFQYLAGKQKLSALAGIPAEGVMKAMELAYPEVLRDNARLIAFAEKHGYVNTMYGYRLSTEKHMEYKGCNYNIQGTAGDLAKNSQLAITDLFDNPQYQKFNFQLLLQIHDEFVIECDLEALSPINTFKSNQKGYWDAPTLVQHLCSTIESGGIPIDCPVPVECKWTVTNWADLQDFDWRNHHKYPSPIPCPPNQKQPSSSKSPKKTSKRSSTASSRSKTL